MKKSQAQLHKPALADRVIALIENARQKVAYTANLAQVYTNYEIRRELLAKSEAPANLAIGSCQIRTPTGLPLSPDFCLNWTHYLILMRIDDRQERYFYEMEAEGNGWSTTALQCQMQTYVHYYDRHVKQPDENPTIGILLCSDDNKALVEMTLPEAEQCQIFARRYSAIIPSKDKLASIIREEQEKYEKEKLLALAAGKRKGRG